MTQRGQSRKRKKSRKPFGSMPMINPLAVGIDIGSEEHWVCFPPSEDGERQLMKFGTTTSEIERMADLLESLGQVSVAMESTYLYWIPPYDVLETRGIEVYLVNARELKGVPSRTKTDAQDCQWIQKLHSFGLLKNSFRPPQEIRAMRTIQRLIARLTEERTRHIQLMQSALDQMNIQLHRAVTNMTGLTGTRIIEAILDGERDPKALAKLRHPRCKKSVDQIAEHLRGTWMTEHLFTLQVGFEQLQHTDQCIAQCEAKLTELLSELEQVELKNESVAPNPDKCKERAIVSRGNKELRDSLYRFAGCDLSRIPGISPDTALIIATEVGRNISEFPTEKNWVSWLRLCPRVAISGGKPVAKRQQRLGANRILKVLYMAAITLQKTDTALGAYFRKVQRRKNGVVAALATARKLAIYIYRMLRYGQHYVDAGAEAYEKKYTARRLASLQRTAKSLGYQLVAAG